MLKSIDGVTGNGQLPRRKQVLVSIYVHRVGIHSEQPRISMCFVWIAMSSSRR